MKVTLVLARLSPLRRVRAFNPRPTAYTFWNNTQLKILRAQASTRHARGEPGRVIKWQDEIAVTTGDGALILHEVQLAGKRAMSAQEFARGQREFVGAMLRNA